jgi:hypothetical protein
MDNSAFEWFTLETKVRKLVLELVEPITRKIADQKLVDEQIQDAIQSHKRRFEEHDLVLERFSRKTQQLDDITRRLSSFENSQAVLGSKMSEEIAGLQMQLDCCAHFSATATASLRSLDSQIEALNKATKTASYEIVNIKTKVLEKLHEIKQKVEEDIQACLGEVKSYEVIFKEANYNFESLSTSIVNLDVKGKSCEQECKLVKRDLQRMKQDVALKNRVALLEEGLMRTRQIFTADQAGQDKEIKQVLGIVQNVHPIQTQLQISEALHHTLSGPQKKAFVQYEIQKFADLTAVSEGMTQTSETEAQQIKEQIKVMVADAQQRAAEVQETIQEEERMALQSPQSRDFHSKHAKRSRTRTTSLLDRTGEEQSSSLKETSRMQSVLGVTASLEEEGLANEEGELGSDELEEADLSIIEKEGAYEELDLTGFKQEIIEEVKLNTEDLMRCLSDEINARLSDVRTESGSIAEALSVKMAELGSTLEETSAYFESLAHSAIDSSNTAASSRKRDQTDIAKEMQRVMKELEAVTEEHSKLTNFVRSVGQITTSVVEFCKITQTLLAQDEEDRQSIALMGYKEARDSSRPRAAPVVPSFSQTTTSRPVVTIDKQCRSCTNQSPIVISAFKMACLAYAPTPISYMSQSYPRRELIDLQGQLLQSSWIKVSALFKPEIGVHKDEVERLSMSRGSTSHRRSSSRPAKLFITTTSNSSNAATSVNRTLLSPRMNLADLSDEGFPGLTTRRKMRA